MINVNVALLDVLGPSWLKLLLELKLVEGHTVDDENELLFRSIVAEL